MQNLLLRGRPPPTVSARINTPIHAFNFVAEDFHAKKLCSRLSSSEVQFNKENGRFAFFEPPLGLEAMHSVHLRLIGKRVVDLLLVSIKLFFARCYG